MSGASESPGIQFRELDVEFLQKQAKVWLEAVLGERFSGDSNLTDILADGEILHAVSKVIRGLLRRNVGEEPVSPKSLFPEAAFYGKSSGKYLPYSNVDSFLKVCQKLGLTGVDLFSPPDVVEKKDIRRVCVCIRALSKKSQSRNLDVPDFDFVTHSVALGTHTVTMPTGLVGGLRDSLRQASSGAASSSSLSTTSFDMKKESMLKTLEEQSGHRYCAAESDEEISGSSSTITGSDEEMPGSTFNGVCHLLHSLSSVGDNASSPRQATDNQIDQFAMRYPDQLVAACSKGDLSSEGDTELLNLGRSLVPDVMDMRESDDSDQTYRGKSVVQATAETFAGECGEGRERKRWLWMPILAGALALLGITLMVRPRVPQMYEVKEGDTLSEISRRTGKSGWKELVHLNPELRNPDLIYPSEKLRIRT
eukprot:c23644_g1_i1 orf=201-1469(+)